MLRGRRPAGAGARRAGELRRAARRDRRPDRPARQRREHRRPGARGPLPRPAGRILVDGEEIPRSAAASSSAAASPTARPTASATASSPSGRSARTSRRPGCARSPPRRLDLARRERRRRGEIAERFAIDTRRLGSPVAHAVGRQPAEGGGRQVARHRAEGDAARGADARRRHRRAGGDLRVAARAVRRGLAIVVVSSDTAEVLGLCDTIAAFYRGRLTSIGRTTNGPRRTSCAR